MLKMNKIKMINIKDKLGKKNLNIIISALVISLVLVGILVTAAITNSSEKIKGNDMILGQDIFLGYRVLSSTGLENWFYSPRIEGNRICFDAKTTKDYAKQTCAINSVTKQKSCTETKTSLNSINSLPMKDMAGNVISSLAKGNLCITITDPLQLLWLKFGLESIVIAGDAAYNSTDFEIQQETGSAHLNISSTAPYNSLAAYYPFDAGYQDFSNNNRDTGSGSCHSLSSGYVGGAVNLDCGDTECAYLNLPPIDVSGSDLTTMAWVNPGFYGTNYYSGIINNPASYQMKLDDNGLIFYLNSGTSGFPGGGVPFSNWTHVAVSVDSSTQNISTFVNGDMTAAYNANDYNADEATCTEHGLAFTAYSCSSSYYYCSSLDHASCLAHSTLCTSNWASCSGGVGGECGGGGCGDCLTEGDCTSNSCDNNYDCSGSGDCSFLDPPSCSEGSDIGCAYTPKSCSIPVFSAGSNPTLGSYDLQNCAGGYKGKVDEAMIFSSAVSGEDINSIYQNTSQRFPGLGTMTFQNLNFGGNTTTNITLENCQTNFGSNLSARINEGENISFTNCKIEDYSLAGIEDIEDANLTLIFNPDSHEFYSPILIGNITLEPGFSNSCAAYSGTGDWNIDCSTNCTINNPVNVNGNVIFSGTGNVILSAPINPNSDDNSVFQGFECNVVMQGGAEII